MFSGQRYKPSEELAPYITQFHIQRIDAPESLVIEDTIMADIAGIRCLLRGEWLAKNPDGKWSTPNKTVLCGINSQPTLVRVTAPLVIAEIAIQPGGWRALSAKDHNEFVDHIVPLQEVWGGLAGILENQLDHASSDEEMVWAMEEVVKERLAQIGTYAEDREIAQFDILARTDSTIKVEEAANLLGLSRRQLQRRCRRCFGISPKAVLRKNRFLDMATTLRGLASANDDQLAELRYFDQSHKNREFKHFTNMTPGEFERANTPIQNTALQMRLAFLRELQDSQDAPLAETSGRAA